jgi:hypothetical protein
VAARFTTNFRKISPIGDLEVRDAIHKEIMAGKVGRQQRAAQGRVDYRENEYPMGCRHHCDTCADGNR